MSLKKTLKKAGKKLKKVAKKAVKLQQKVVPLAGAIASGGVSGGLTFLAQKGLSKAGKYSAPIAQKIDDQASNAGFAGAGSPGYSPAPSSLYDAPIGPQMDGGTGGESWFERNKALVLGGAAVGVVLLLVVGGRRK